MRTANPAPPRPGEDEPDPPGARPAPPAPRAAEPRWTGPGRATAAAALAPALTMLGLGLWGLDRGTLWRDEAASFQAARRTLPELAHLLGGIDAVHGLYYLLLHAVLSLRADEVALRLPSVLAAACTAGLIGALGARLARPRVGLWAGLLYAATPFASHYAQEGRSYALVAAAAAAATLCLVRAVERGSAGRWAAYAAATMLTALLHELALLLLAAHALTLLACRARLPERTGRRWGAAAGATLAAVLPLVLLSHRQEGQISWIETPGRGQALALLRDFAGPSGLVLAVNLALIAVALLGAWDGGTSGDGGSGAGRMAGGGAHGGAYGGAAGSGRSGRPLTPVAVALPLATAGPALLFAAARWEPLFVDRYVLFALAGVPLLAATGAECLVRRLRLPSVPVALAGALAVAAAFGWQLPLHERERRPVSRQDDLAAVAHLVRERTKPGDALLFVPSAQRRIALAYPRAFTGRRDLALERPVAASGTLDGREVPPRELRARLAGTERVWVVAEPGVVNRAWFRRNRREQSKLAALHADFTTFSTAQSRSGTITLLVRGTRVQGGRS
ncbi:glycosyltransferase family 39 protein [Streptomyces pathocidini]|uniref:Glycosyltransferase family 39 protein n=1 Tax=Streptomyces pathocidini TaxID=1650571 RepID=A0ABW7UW70_9ACTN